MNTAVQRRKITNPNKQTHVVAPTSRNTLSVGCKLPHGIHMDINIKGEPIQRVTLKGINSLTQGMVIRPAQIGGFAITENVPKEFFEEWMKQNRHHPAVVNQLIFAHTQRESVKDMAEDRDELKHGFEPIDPNKKVLGPNGKVAVESRTEDD